MTFFTYFGPMPMNERIDYLDTSRDALVAAIRLKRVAESKSELRDKQYLICVANDISDLLDGKMSKRPDTLFSASHSIILFLSYLEINKDNFRTKLGKIYEDLQDVLEQSENKSSKKKATELSVLFRGIHNYAQSIVHSGVAPEFALF